MHFGTAALFRFNDPQELFGVLYCGTSIETCVLEKWGEPRQRVIDWPQGKYPEVATVIPHDEIRLVDLTAGGATHLGADSRLQSETDYDLTQPWARAIYETGRFDGIWYEARKGGNFGVALFDIAEEKVTLRREGDILDSPWVYKLIDVSETHGFVIEPFNYDPTVVGRLLALGIRPPS